jgi:prepilin-type N-terminal cleavage/methylation domain-containing protein/prepilin-type processing-associated H-X9-DG protein
MRHQRSRGFTLVELLVVIAIIGILVALLLPAIQAAREAARRTQCTNNLKQLGLAIQTYHDSYKMFPPGAVRPYYGSAACSYPGGLTWIARVLPGLEQQPLYDQIDWELANPFSGGLNVTVVAPTKLAALRCPSDPAPAPNVGYGPNNYVGCSGSDGSSYPSAGAVVGLMRESTTCNTAVCTNCTSPLATLCSMAKVTDGTSTTMAISECLIARPFIYDAVTAGGANVGPCNAGTVAVPPTSNYRTRGLSWMSAVWSETWAFSTWYPPNDVLHDKYECYWYSAGNYYGARSQHPGGVNVCFTDGSTRFIGNNIDLITWRALSTIAGQEAIPSF